MAEKNVKYPYFLFYEEWYDYIGELSDPLEQYALFCTIAHYGLYEIEPKDGVLSSGVMGYFRQIVRPNIDQQHAKYNAQQQSKERRKIRKANAKTPNIKTERQ